MKTERTTSGSARVRVELARLALAEALATRGVIAAVEGPNGLWITVGGGERVGGVTAFAQPDGHSYEIGLHLVTQLVPLRPLAEGIRSRIERAAAGAGLADALGPIDIAFEDAREPGEV